MIKILLLCGDNNRAKSYASILKKSPKYSVTGLLYGITKDVNKLRVSKKQKQKKNVDPDVPRKISALERPVEISAELSEFLELPVGEHQSRQFITQKINKFVKDNDIQNPDNRRYILLDSSDKGKALGKLLREPDQPLTFFNIQRYLKVHYVQSENTENKDKTPKKTIDATEVEASTETPPAEKPKESTEAPTESEKPKEAPAEAEPVKKKVIRRVVKKSV